jgi:hypothetical protein
MMHVKQLFLALVISVITPQLNAADLARDHDDFSQELEQERAQKNLIEIDKSFDKSKTEAKPRRKVRKKMLTTAQRDVDVDVSVDEDLNNLSTCFSDLTFDDSCVACSWPKKNCACLQVVDFLNGIHAPCMACDLDPCACTNKDADALR